MLQAHLMAFPRWIAGLFLHCLIAAPSLGDDPLVVRKQILTSWDAADHEVLTIDSTVTREHFRTRDGITKQYYSETIRWRLLPHRYLFEYARVEPNSNGKFQTERELTNDKYAAKIMKPRPDAAWVLTEHKATGSDTAAYSRNVTLPWTALANVQFTEWLRDPAVSLTRVERPGGSIVRLHFELKEVAGKKPISDLLRSGYIDFNEERNHCVLGYRMHNKSQFSEFDETCLCEYKSSPGIPSLQKVTIDSPDIRSAKFGNFGSRAVYQYDIQYNTDISDDEFWLSHYGLPEPFGVVRETKTPRYVWFLIAAGVFAVLAVGLRMLSQRRKTTRIAT